MSTTRLALTWFNQDKALLARAGVGYEWVERDDPRVTEVRLFRETSTVGDVTGTPADNLLIQGDAYDALHALNRVPEYAEHVKGKVKLVYIDPPFNTGQAFDDQYDDNFDHSLWLSMFRDRIRQLVPLLSEDGSIWVHLDDAEVHRARLVLDQEVGINNFIAEVVWEKADSPNNSAKYLSKDQDVVLVYAKDKTVWRPNRLPRSAASDAFYDNPDNDPRGRWYPGDPYANKPYSLGLYEITGPTGRTFKPPKGRYWRISEAKFREFEADARIYWGPDGNARPSIKRFLSEVEGLTPRTLWRHVDVGSNRTSKNEMRALFPDLPSFATPKPERFMQRVLQTATEPGDLVLDCFGGSGSTAAVAHKMGRRWITVEAIATTVRDYMVPRLTKVVEGTDLGGITFAKERETDLDLPDGMTVTQIDETRKALETLVKAEAIEVEPEAFSMLVKQLQTKPSKQRQWDGGGGFRVLTVEPPKLTFAGRHTFLADGATESLEPFVAAQLGYTLAPERAGVAGVKGRDVLVTVSGMIDEGQVRYALTLLDEGETLTMAGLAVHPAATNLLAELRTGSRTVKVPDGLVKRSKVTR